MSLQTVKIRFSLLPSPLSVSLSLFSDPCSRPADRASRNEKLRQGSRASDRSSAGVNGKGSRRQLPQHIKPQGKKYTPIHVGPQMLSLPQPTACTHYMQRKFIPSSLTSGIQCFSPETTRYIHINKDKCIYYILYMFCKICYVICLMLFFFFFLPNNEYSSR